MPLSNFMKVLEYGLAPQAIWLVLYFVMPVAIIYLSCFMLSSI